jgi:quercetin dioxygenase-like cupin family protein
MKRPEFISGNVFIRPNRLDRAGDRIAGHTHNFDHTTIFFSGRFRVKATLPDGRVIESEFTAPDHCLIRADATHEIVALDDASEFWCVYSHRDPQGRVTQVRTGWPDAYL